MINEVYQLIAPKLIDTAYKEIDLSKNEVILRPVKMSICKADQRYYQGLRNRAVLMKKLPMALIHECVAEVIYDPSGEFSVGEMLIPIPIHPPRPTRSSPRTICVRATSARAAMTALCATISRCPTTALSRCQRASICA